MYILYLFTYMLLPFHTAAHLEVSRETFCSVVSQPDLDKKCLFSVKN